MGELGVGRGDEFAGADDHGVDEIAVAFEQALGLGQRKLPGRLTQEEFVVYLAPAGDIEVADFVDVFPESPAHFCLASTNRDRLYLL